MDKQHWERIDEIVDAALDLSGKERAKFIKKQCQGDHKLEKQVTNLISAIEESESENFLEDFKDYPLSLAREISETKDDDNTSSLIGTIIDKYEIIELIAHGGMGSVYLARRADKAFSKKVALKILRQGMDTPSNVARFKRERNILADLDHPNIARMLDGGVTQSGLPYLVMEYVNGTPLLEYSDNHRLTIEQRLDLFKSVCKAIQYAHRNATIHRDLKPSNIFVTEEGVIKLLDFGIAKLMEQKNTEKTLFQTKTGTRILTLAYAAPEQVKNNNITTATDSYTLGILLYELLTGTHPFDMENHDLSEIEELICSKTPTNPSTNFEHLPREKQNNIASKRNTTPAELAQEIKGDLDAICMKALRKEPETRYNSVEQMGKDLNRYEQALPLIAQSDTIKYRVGKFIRRNKKNIIIACMVLIAIFGFGTYHIQLITEERNIAEKEAQKAETVKNFLVDIFRSTNPQSVTFEGKDLTAKELLISGKDKISPELKDQPDVHTEILFSVGDALTNIDAFREAEKSFKKAIEISPETQNPLENRIRAYVKLGKLESKRRLSDQAILKPANKAHNLLRQMENPPSALEASVFSLLGRVNVFVENYEQASSYYKKADSIYTSSKIKDSFNYIQMLSGYGKSLIYVSEYNKAEQVLLKSNELHHEEFSKPTMTIAENYKFLGWVHRDLGNFKKSNSYFLKSIELNRQLSGEKSMSTALSMHHLYINYFLAGDYKKTEELSQKVLNIYKQLLNPTNDHIQRPKKYLALAKYKQGQLLEAKGLLQEIIQIRTEQMGEESVNLAGPYSHLAVVYQKQGNYQKAVSLLEKSIRLYKRKLGEFSRRTARAMIKLANVYREMGKYQQAHEYFKQIETIHKKVVPDKNHQQADFYFEYGKLYRDMGNSQQAQKYFRKAHAIYLDNFGDDSNRTQKVKSHLNNLAKAS